MSKILNGSSIIALAQRFRGLNPCYLAHELEQVITKTDSGQSGDLHFMMDRKQRKETQEGVRQDTAPKETFSVTYFLQ